MKQYKPLTERFFDKTVPEPNSGCLLWTGSAMPFGHGRIFVRGVGVVGAHRVAWEMANGAIPDGQCVCHRCDTPACVNPDHLFLGTHRENIADCVAKGRNKNPRADVERAQTHCHLGHAFDAANTLVYPSGKRECRECRRLIEHRRNARRRTARGQCHNRAKTQCKRGHPFDEKNTHVYDANGRKYRTCRACGALAARASTARKRAEVAV